MPTTDKEYTVEILLNRDFYWIGILLNRDFIEVEIGIHSILVLTRPVLVWLQSSLGENSHNLPIPGLATEIPALATGANAGQKE